MHRHLFPLVLLITAVLAGCAAPPKAVVRPSTPSALVADSATGGGFGGGAFFFVAEADGQAMENNNLLASRRASAGKGANLQLVPVERYLPAGRTRLKLSARYDHAAPIQSLFSSAASYAADGTVEVELKADGHYRVTGLLDPFKREVWLEDQDTGTIVGAKVVGAADKAAMAASAASGLYTCCNLHYEGDWISDANPMELPMIPAGSRIVLKEFGSNRVAVEIEGRRMRLGLDYGREQQTIQAFASRVAVKSDPRVQIATFPAAVQAAIAAGKVRLGMSKEQVVMALGYPRTDKTRVLDAKEWSFATQTDEEFILMWDADDRLKDVDASRRVKQAVLMAE